MRMNTDEDGTMSSDKTPDSRPAWEAFTEVIIGGAFRVANTLGPGFLEKVYEHALAHEIRKRGLQVVQQEAIDVLYDGIVVGQYAADLMVEETVIVELKVARSIDDVHMAQCLNYLKATGKPVCLLLNFGTGRIALKRILNPAVPEAWIHPADDIMLEGESEDGVSVDTGFDLTPPIRVHPHPSVVPNA
jgi:GxxExxY protein